MKKLNLSSLERANVSRKQMSKLKGGNTCGCSCFGQAPSSEIYFSMGLQNYNRGYVDPFAEEGFIYVVKEP
jgi:natural product precursor